MFMRISQKATYRHPGGLITVYQRALILEVWLALALTELGLSILLFVHLDILFRDAVEVGLPALSSLLDLVLNTRPHILEVGWVSRLDDIVCC